MNRRDFLRRSLYGVAAWPLFVQTAFADEPTVRDLARDLSAARLAGRNLLIFVIPNDELHWSRGQALGTFLNHGDKGVLARLTTVQVACASRSAIETLTRTPIDASAALVHVNLTAVPAAVTTQPLVVDLEPLSALVSDLSWEERRAQDAIAVDEMLETVQAAFVALLPEPVANLTAALEDVQTRIINAPPTGAQWARASGCGTSIEGQNDLRAYRCGMGHVPDRTQRFLLFPSDA